MRNRLIHVYFDIDLIIVYKTATKDIPPLVNNMYLFFNNPVSCLFATASL